MQLGLRPPLGRQEQGAGGLGPALQGALGSGRSLLHVHPVRAHAHEQVGPRPRAELSPPRREVLGRCLGQVLGQRRHDQAVVGLHLVDLGDDPAQPWLRGLVVGAVHPEHGPHQGVAQLGLVGLDAADKGFGVVGHRRSVAVADPEVLGAHRRPVGRCPPEGGAVDGSRHPPPDDGVFEAGEAEELGHLGHVAEHVGQVAHGHGSAEGGRPLETELEVAHHGLARHTELVHQHVPGPDREPAARRQPPQTLFGVRAQSQVVVDHRHLTVEHVAGVGGVGLEARQQLVEQLDQLQAEGLEGRVPLPVPVGVGDDGDRPGHGLSVRGRYVAVGWQRCVSPSEPTSTRR